MLAWSAAIRRLGNATKTQSPLVGGDKTHAVHAALQANETAGIKLTHKQIAEALNVSQSTVGEAARDLKAARSIEQFTYTKAQEHHVEARIKVELKAAMEQLHRSFEAEVQKRNKVDIDILFPKLDEMQTKATTTEKIYRGLIEKIAIFTKTEYIDILFCVRNEHVSQERRDRATIAFESKKLQLTGEK